MATHVKPAWSAQTPPSGQEGVLPYSSAMRILVDIDDTLTDTTEAWQDLIAVATGSPPDPSLLSGSNWFAQFGLTRPEFEWLIDRVYHERSRISANRAYPGAAQAIAAWRAAGHLVTIASDRRTAARSATVAWLEAAGIGYDELVLRRHLDKVALVRRIGAGLAIDDRPENLRRFTRALPELRLATLRTRENAQDLAEFKDLVVADDWAGLATALAPILAPEH